MNKITRKLRSRRGASMILALVFLLFALFVGGTVLASAAANGYRAAHLSDQQEYLNQRSAAMLIADELGDGLTLSITEEVTESASAEGTGTTTTRLVTISAPASLVMTPLQRVMVEAAIGQFMEIEELGIGQVTLTGFQYDNEGAAATIASVDNFWLYNSSDYKIATGGSVKLALSGAEGEIPANVQCLGNVDDRYDIVITVGESGSMCVTMDGYTGSGKPVPDTNNANKTTKQIAISWDAPVIEKGSVTTAETEGGETE